MRKLWLRLSLAFAALALLAVSGMALALNLTLSERFRAYIDQERNLQALDTVLPTLTDYYATNGNWDNVAALMPGPAGGNSSGQQSTGQSGEGNAPGDGPRGIRYVVYDATGTVVYARDDSLLGRTDTDLSTALPITVAGEIVGYITVETPGQSVLSAAQADFLAGVQQTLAFISSITVVLAVLAGVTFSQLISRPLARLDRAANAMAAGELGVQVGSHPLDAEELDHLAQAFNHMSAALAESEAQRQQATADIAHELRTPVSVIRGQLQAMLDGVTPLDVASVATAYDQSIHLARLVEDLRTLTRAASGHLPLVRETLDLRAVLQQTALAFAPLADDAGFQLCTNLPESLPSVNADADRIRQVLANLLTNALRYATPGGEIGLTADVDDEVVRIDVSNLGVTLTHEAAQHVFERFWRSDAARVREDGSGLGLAISEQLVRLHGGKIWVELHDLTQTTHFIFTLPVIST